MNRRQLIKAIAALPCGCLPAVRFRSYRGCESLEPLNKLSGPPALPLKVDMSRFDEGLRRMREKLAEIGMSAEQATESATKLITLSMDFEGGELASDDGAKKLGEAMTNKRGS